MANLIEALAAAVTEHEPSWDNHGRAIAALRAIDEAGYAVVPKQPDEHMKFAAAHLKGVAAANRMVKPNSIEVYRAMLAAAPDVTGEAEE